MSLEAADPTLETIPEDETINDYNNGVAQSLPPSHILEDGRFIYLPPPDNFERSRFFKRSIAYHGIAHSDMTGGENVEEALQKEEDPEEDKDTTAPWVHPLEVASARLQSHGLMQLNQAINLAYLVQTGDYFTLTNIVDPSLEENEEGGAVAAQSIDAVKSAFVLKRKRAQFQKATETLERHEKRLRAAIKAQRVLDQRLFQLRQQWRLVAPEHGTRARLHAARPTEVVAIDVDVYDRDRVGGGSQALKSTSIGKRQTLAGRLASRVPRFATIELRDGFKVENDQVSNADEPNEMEVDELSEESMEISRNTQAEPFAVADPTLGRVAENFDSTKVPMLNLQLDIQKSSTGFLQSSCLEPITTLKAGKEGGLATAQDENVLVNLQHSLFCASLFESIRSEVDPQPDTSSQFSAAQRNQPPVSWLSCESEENFLPAPNREVGRGFGLSPLTVVHCHEGEVKVQLDTEYTLCVRLVEANVETEKRTSSTEENKHGSNQSSGSQTPKQLHALCRALLLHAQNVYHRHSLYLRDRAKQKEEEEKKEEQSRGDGPRGLARISKEDKPELARILQSCVSLGSKILYEKRIRQTLIRVVQWLKDLTSERMFVEWLALSLFDLHSHFTLCFQQLTLDVTIVHDSMTVCRIAEGGEHRKVSFQSDREFEIFLKLELRRQLKQ